MSAMSLPPLPGNLDSTLVVLVSEANRHTDDIPGHSVTLALDGLIISGDLIGAWQYWARSEVAVGWSEDTEGNWIRDLIADSRDAAEEARKAIEAMGAAADAGETISADVQAKIDAAIPRYLHLAEAQWIIGNRPQPASGMLWRCRLTSISGWTFGRAAPSD